MHAAVIVLSTADPITIVKTQAIPEASVVGRIAKSLAVGVCILSIFEANTSVITANLLAAASKYVTVIAFCCSRQQRDRNPHYRN
jgi:hypothetical protein